LPRPAIIRTAPPAAAESVARNDPYVINGLVTHWEVRRWNTVVGATAANPVR
jgi:uncharacterized protein YciI